MVKLDLMHGEWNGHEVLPKLKRYGHGIMIFVIYGLLWVTGTKEGRLYRPTRMVIMLLHSILSPSLESLVLHIGGLFPWPMSSNMSWKHLHNIPLPKDKHSPKENFLWKTLKTGVLALARLVSSSLMPMGEIHIRGHTNWRTVPIYHSCEAN